MPKGLCKYKLLYSIVSAFKNLCFKSGSPENVLFNPITSYYQDIPNSRLKKVITENLLSLQMVSVWPVDDFYHLVKSCLHVSTWSSCLLPVKFILYIKTPDTQQNIFRNIHSTNTSVTCNRQKNNSILFYNKKGMKLISLWLTMTCKCLSWNSDTQNSF